MEVIITSEPDKLPPDVRALIDEAQPLAPGIRFFEERYTLLDMGRTVGAGILLGVIGLVCCLFGVSLFFYVTQFESYDLAPLFAGGVFLFASWMMISSLGGRWRVMRKQQAGTPTRYGLFLKDDMLVSNSWFQTTVIPRLGFLGLQNRSVLYLFDSKTKSFTLPKAVVGTEAAQLDAAIETWAGQGA